MSIGNVIKQSRLSQSLKQSTVASEVGVTVQTYIKWENDETEPKASQVEKLSKILGISSSSICKGERFNKMEMTAFIRYFSKVIPHANDFEVGLTVWNQIENDHEFISELRKNAGIPFNPASQQYIPEEDDVIFYDELGNVIEDPLFKKS